MRTISPRQISEQLSAGSVDLIDVRTPAEFREVHAQGARNIPLDSLDPDSVMESRQDRRDQPLYVMCKTGGRASKACKMFQDAGYGQVINVEGGVQAWEAAQLPVARGKQTMSLERQVRIAAGLLVLIGVALAYLVHPYLIGVSAFVGAGLMFAGITDSCAMGMLLAKMPWNQVAESPSAACTIKH